MSIDLNHVREAMRKGYICRPDEPAAQDIIERLLREVEKVRKEKASVKFFFNFSEKGYRDYPSYVVLAANIDEAKEKVCRLLGRDKKEADEILSKYILSVHEKINERSSAAEL